MVAMVVQVRLFAMLRERAGRESVEVELDDGATVQDALDAVARLQGLGELVSRMPVVMAVNREYVPEESLLSEGDELALIPPVSGGAGERPNPRAARNTAPGSRDGKIDTTPAPDGMARFEALVSREVPAPPYSKLLGSRPLDAEPGHVRMEFTATEQMLNPAGSVQGGFLTAMLDETMGPAAISMLEPGFVAPTLELKVSFLRPARPGRLVVDARVVHMGRSVAFMESSLVTDDGSLVATATATARIVPFKKPDA
jgi:molybdopterin converting factor subunit 1